MGMTMARHDPVPHDKLAESARRNLRASVWRPKHPRESFRHAVEGLGHAFRTQRNMRFHVAAFLVLFLGALILRIPRLEMIALVVCFSSVLFAEMMNTAIEATVDMITDRYHPAAKYVKDLAAGAVLVTATAAAVIGSIIFLGALNIDVMQRRMVFPTTFPVVLGGYLVLMVIVLVGKTLAGRGSVMQGGAISGHAATAFFVATVIAVSFPDIWIIAGSYALAALVAQSRVEGQIHSIREVAIGGVVATIVGVLIVGAPKWLGTRLDGIEALWQGVLTRVR
jgi:diacylglycerol kinase (ATP)